SKKIFADLPPNSRVEGIKFSAAEIPIRRPISVEPVKAILSIPLWCCKYSPDLEPRPVTKLKTPLGRTSFSILANSKTLNEVLEEGLNTIVLPAASAGAIFQAAIKNGKFQGTICATTPIGSRK